MNELNQWIDKAKSTVSDEEMNGVKQEEKTINSLFEICVLRVMKMLFAFFLFTNNREAFFTGSLSLHTDTVSLHKVTGNQQNYCWEVSVHTK